MLIFKCIQSQSLRLELTTSTTSLVSGGNTTHKTNVSTTTTCEYYCYWWKCDEVFINKSINKMLLMQTKYGKWMLFMYKYISDRWEKISVRDQLSKVNKWEWNFCVRWVHSQLDICHFIEKYLLAIIFYRTITFFVLFINHKLCNVTWNEREKKNNARK